MTTFSQVIDTCSAEMARPDYLNFLPSWLNQVVRECHLNPNSAERIPVGFARNLIEAAIVTNTDTGFVWDFPRPQRFQFMDAVLYADIGKYADERKLSRARIVADAPGQTRYWYRSGNGLVFSGYPGIGATINVGYYEYPRRLIYYAQADRPCDWDEEDEAYVYHTVGATNYDLNDTTRASARDLCTNWIFETWPDIPLQGLRVKVSGRQGDSEKNRIGYAAWQQLLPGFIASESYVSPARYSR